MSFSSDDTENEMEPKNYSKLDDYKGYKLRREIKPIYNEDDYILESPFGKLQEKKKTKSITKRSSKKRISDEILEFHHLTRSDDKHRFIVCISCKKSIPNCACCLRSSTFASKLELKSPPKCTGCLNQFHGSLKPCINDETAVECRQLESIKRRKRRKFVIEDDSDSEQEISAQVEVPLKQQVLDHLGITKTNKQNEDSDTESDTNSIVKKYQESSSTSLCTTPALSEVQSQSSIKLLSNFSSQTSSSYPTSITSVVDQLIRMNSQLSEKNSTLVSNNAKLTNQLQVSNLNNERNKSKIKFLEKQLKEALEKQIEVMEFMTDI